MKKPTQLLIVESPAKIKTLSKFLGQDFKIMSTFGHIKDLPPKKLGVTITEGTKKHISLEYKTLNDKEKIIKNICSQARNCDTIYLASDPDREGEIIAWHIGQEIESTHNKTHEIYRITFNEITKSAVTQALEKRGAIDQNKVSAQQARRVLDRWVGYKVSPILWKKIKKGLSAGRVQSVALYLICKRDEDIKNFKSVESWSIHALYLFKKEKLNAELIKIDNKSFKLKNKKEADAVIEQAKKELYSVADIKEKKRLKKPLPPFMTSTLQQDAYNRLGFSVEKTMRVAQKLYEGITLADKNTPEALITYMRTDSLRIADTALNAVRSFIKESYGNTYLSKTVSLYGKKGAQDAHEAIRPVNVAITPEMVAQYASKDAAQLYELIWKRYVACQMSPAEYFQREVLIKGGRFLFKILGSTLVFDGFLKIYSSDEGEEKNSLIPQDLSVGSELDLKKIEGKQHFTQPPARYTEATLVKELEKLGIGRPSTYAAILATIQQRTYVEKEKKRFNPTELGIAVNALLIKNLPDIINVSFTAQMEEDLDKIAQGEEERDQVLLSFYEKFQHDLEVFAGESTGKTPILAGLQCPQCKKDLYIRFGKTGEFIGCSGFPECTFTSGFSRDEKGIISLKEKEPPKTSDITCPQCGKKLIERVGRYGPFLSCPGYPECKYIHEESLATPCPQCGSKLVKRRWRGGVLWGCSAYPQCRFSLFGDVEERPCPSCKKPFVFIKTKRDGGTTYQCTDKECGWNSKIKDVSS